MQILDHVNPPPVEVFYQRNDPNDQRLGETVQVDAAAYDSAHVVILGCPQDEGVRRNKGRLGSAHAPDAIRGALYRLVALENTELILFDAGNTKIQDELEDTHALHASLVQQIIRDGKRVITLGGGNDVSYPDCYGLVQAGHTVMAINVDAHFDVRADAIRNSGTPYRQLLEEGFVLPQNFYEIASVPMSNSAVYRAYLLEKGAHIIDLFAVQQRSIAAVLDGILSRDSEAIFWGLDMDVVRAADAPGVSAPNALGLSGMEFCQVAARAGSDPRSRVFEITEVNPTYDIDSRTSRLAAAAIHQFLVNLTVE